MTSQAEKRVDMKRDECIISLSLLESALLLSLSVRNDDAYRQRHHA